MRETRDGVSLGVNFENYQFDEYVVSTWLWSQTWSDHGYGYGLTGIFEQLGQVLVPEGTLLGTMAAPDL